MAEYAGYTIITRTWLKPWVVARVLIVFDPPLRRPMKRSLEESGPSDVSKQPLKVQIGADRKIMLPATFRLGGYIVAEIMFAVHVYVVA